MTLATPQHQTASNLIDAALHLFAHKGYDATSTRELAARAGTNVASIAYHFGGKAGLRTACARHVAETVSTVFTRLDPPDPMMPAIMAQAQIETLVQGFVQLVVGTPGAQDMVTFVVRELADPGEVAGLIYTQLLEPRHIAICQLMASATGRDADDEDLKLAVFSTIGQIVYFRIARPFVQQRMGWGALDQPETQKITQTIIASLRDAIERLRI